MSGRGHSDVPVEQLHFGVRLNGAYVDPIPLLQPASVVDLIRLAPDDTGTASAATDILRFAKGAFVLALEINPPSGGYTLTVDHVNPDLLQSPP